MFLLSSWILQTMPNITDNAYSEGRHKPGIVEMTQIIFSEEYGRNLSCTVLASLFAVKLAAKMPKMSKISKYVIYYSHFMQNLQYAIYYL